MIEPFRTGGNISVISALTLEGARCAMMIEGAIDGEALRSYAEHILVPELKKGDIVIWDNVRTHTNSTVIAEIEKSGARIVALPAYSPDLNPKEECISKIKSVLRQSKARTMRALRKALKHAYSIITPNDARGWFKHCGYSAP